jgi:hypothetical protein
VLEDFDGSRIWEELSVNTESVWSAACCGQPCDSSRASQSEIMCHGSSLSASRSAEYPVSRLL